MPRPDTHDNPEITIDTASTSSSSYSISTRSRNAQTVASSSASISSSSDDEYEVPVQFLAPEDNGEVRQRRSSVASSASFASLASIAIFDTVPEDHKLDIRGLCKTFFIYFLLNNQVNLPSLQRMNEHLTAHILEQL